MHPSSYQPAQDLTAYNNEPVFVVGCGTQPVTHAGQPHRIPAGYIAPGAALIIPLQAAYTMDINPGMNPHRVGSFWIADHTEDLPSDSFRLVYFENLPGNLFTDRGWALTAIKTAQRLLMPNGVVVIRAGMGTINPGSALDVAMQDTFGPLNAVVTQDTYGMYVDIQGKK